MRDRMEKLALPFSIGCVSESSVAIGVHHPRRTKQPPALQHMNPSLIRKKEDDEESLSSTESMKNGLKFHAVSKPNISDRFHRLVKGFKTFSQLFVYEEEEEEMEIGGPTDVKHVTHIGWDDGSENLISPGLLSLHQTPASLTQFQLFMASHPHSSPTLVND
ncbi:CRIB domain-containing protein RIC4 [Manihot esculenta]|uniref:CRIB domain-containing protein n=1 Tax=Manihot esculenta TaxID=3983 RepID=A0A2C9UMW1_MANES|nr:CRIB domain-containing protein RIC4 [Manihot esculenta]OAY32279.1 hypothetical protein MANES_13G005800v8 [Manihot esculenta]